MALQATHIRFAIEMKDKCSPSNLEEFIAGTVYPDSRYVTNTPRELTHLHDFMEWDLNKIDDFKKGWFLHLLCDKVQEETTLKLFPDIFSKEGKQYDEGWAKYTVIKMLQDFYELENFDLKPYLPYLKHARNPNGEDIEKIKWHNQIFSDMYTEQEKIELEDHLPISRKLGASESVIESLKKWTENFRADTAIMEKIQRMYPEMIRLARERIQ